MSISKVFTTILFLFFSAYTLSSQASTQSSILLSSDTEINYSVFKTLHKKEPNHLLLWFYSEAGPKPSDQIIAKQLSELGIEVWIIDLFDSYFLPAALSSMDKIPEAEISEFIQLAHKSSNKEITIVTSGRSAIPLLRASRYSQNQLPANNALNNIILISPKLFTKTPEPGQAGELMPIVSSSNQLLFILQPAKSPWFWKLDTTIPALEKSGSDVYFKIIKDVRDRFYFRPDADQYENTVTEQLPHMISNAIQILSRHPNKIRKPNTTIFIKPKTSSSKQVKRLKPHTGEALPPPLNLSTLNNTSINLKNLKDKVVLVNFWATWCPPCVHEMPSMQRLQDKFKKDGFVILGVNMAEDTATIDKFIKSKVSINFPVLLDKDGAALKRWEVFAFPTSYLIDKKGKIRYSLFGSIEWDTDRNISIINKLINEN